MEESEMLEVIRSDLNQPSHMPSGILERIRSENINKLHVLINFPQRSCHCNLC